MLKSIKNTMKLDREKVKIPRRVQDTIPVKEVYEDGVFQVAKNKYSKSWKFTDINYDVLSLSLIHILDLPSLGERKVALFAIIPDNDTSFNFLVSILYTQLFQQLFYLADHKYGGRLPVHCQMCIRDRSCTYSIEADKTSANPGDTINFTIYIGTFNQIRNNTFIIFIICIFSTNTTGFSYL